MLVKMVLVLETEQTSARITISDLRSILSQYLILQLESSYTINFAWHKSWEAMPQMPAIPPLPPVLPALLSMASIKTEPLSKYDAKVLNIYLTKEFPYVF